MLFSDRERLDRDAKKLSETDWEYLDRSGRIEAERVRSFLEEWFSRYPEAHRSELKARMFKSEEHDYYSAAFELILFAALTSLGCAVQVHAPVKGTANKPDFWCKAPGAQDFYVEAVLASEFNDAHKKARKRSRSAIDALEGIDSAGFYLYVDESGQPDTSPRSSRLRNKVVRWLGSLDAEKVRQEVWAKGYHAAPSMRWEHDGWEVDIRAWPSQTKHNEQVVGARAESLRQIEPVGPARRAIVEKAKKYRDLAGPFLIALNVESLVFDRSDEMQALFGDEVYLLRLGEQGVETLQYRKPNGAWRDFRGSRYKRVSGVWIFNNLSPWRAAHSDGTLYLNPCALRPLPKLLHSVNHARSGEDGDMQWFKGISLRELLHLPEGWPG